MRLTHRTFQQPFGGLALSWARTFERFKPFKVNHESIGDDER